MRNGDRKRVTYEDIRDLPEGTNAEILDGELYIAGRPAGTHGYAEHMLAVVLTTLVGQGRPGGWWLLTEPELHLGEDVLIPDLGGWRKERLAAPYTGAFTTVAPDWVCEILSPSTSRIDRALKLPIYAREQVGHLWLLDPVKRRLEVHRREGHQWRLLSTFSEAARARAEPFDALELALSELWHPDSTRAPAPAP